MIASPECPASSFSSALLARERVSILGVSLANECIVNMVMRGGVIGTHKRTSDSFGSNESEFKYYGGGRFFSIPQFLEYPTFPIRSLDRINILSYAILIFIHFFYPLVALTYKTISLSAFSKRNECQCTLIHIPQL
jgi:hypothetical protein